jgi:hypothetical protein
MMLYLYHQLLYICNSLLLLFYEYVCPVPPFIAASHTLYKLANYYSYYETHPNVNDADM